MKKQFLNLGKALNKAEQKEINGGTPYGELSCSSNEDCKPYECCADKSCIHVSRPACNP